MERGSEHERARQKMVVEQLEQRDVRSPTVLETMRWIPRHQFVPDGYQASAYADGALPIDCRQTISQPYMVARMTELLEIAPKHVLLEVGTGSGYQTAVLATLAAHVYTIEWYGKLMTQAARRLSAIGVTNVSFRCGDGSLGWPGNAPYDGIMVTAGAPDVPEPLLAQMRTGGRMVIPVGPAGDQSLIVVRRTSTGVEREEIMRCRFVKLVGDAGWREGD